jgi:hypothetical protein
LVNLNLSVQLVWISSSVLHVLVPVPFAPWNRPVPESPRHHDDDSGRHDHHHPGRHDHDPHHDDHDSSIDRRPA